MYLGGSDNVTLENTLFGGLVFLLYLFAVSGAGSRINFFCPILSKTGTDGSASPQILYIVLTHHYRVSDSARILTYPPFGISRSKNQFVPISACTSRSGRSRGSSTASGLEGASHCIRRFTRARPFLLNAFPRWSGLVFNRLHCVLVSSSLLHSTQFVKKSSEESANNKPFVRTNLVW